MSGTWDEHARDWDDNPDVRAYADKAFASLKEHTGPAIGANRYGRVLDFGCGTGLLSEKLAPVAGQIVAIDTSSAMIDVLKSKSIENVIALCVDIDAPSTVNLPALGQPFDLIVASSALAFVPDYRTIVGNLVPLLREGGLFVQWDWLKSGDGGFGLTSAEISAACKDAGLADTRVLEAFVMEGMGDAMTVLMGVGTR
ncbi:class I SAM-dependent DNA methyltransferase [Hoeflea poritis]|uniref:Class I SAM-dependent methyltransferase n=1 Tax=Hoeflea poritis TaxID=2993659 RepID=A0ABT4VVQ3_9HYPH|nr:class I SAM-dependent methyltransferase [Hoeflea poritis]MDA4848800.1 class I SAM-dependent methyltransferase [Hoeflea poritis]